MRRALPFALVIAAIGACTFPEAQYSEAGVTPGDDSGGSSGSSSGSGSGSSSGTDGSSGSSSGGEASAGSSSGEDATSGDAPADVTKIDSSSSSGSGSSSGGPNCDMDGDGFKSNSVSCGGSDCCDTDANAHPGQTTFFQVADKCNSFDYNCNGSEDPKYGNSLSCSGIPTTGCMDHCQAVPTCASGYLGADPGCGNAATFGSCQADPMNPLSCVPTTTGTQPQLCN